MSEAVPDPTPSTIVSADYSGARRGRRAFRFAVLTVVSLTFALWFSEGYLRYDRAETQYRMSLTLPTASARPVLRNVVKRDAEKNGTASAKYVEAQAAVEESDKVLEWYEQAYKLNPNNSFLMINYGCRLYRENQFVPARERFHEAGVRPPRNALPKYLEAAAMTAAMKDDNELSEIFSLIAQTNSSEDPVLFPQPLWHPSLPTDGALYAKLRRELVDQACAPLYQMKTTLLARAKANIDKREIKDWDSWLEKLQGLGQKLLGNAQSDATSLGSDQAIAGIQIQLDAIEARQQIAEVQQAKRDPALIERAVKLNSAMMTLKKFENQRDATVEENSGWLTAPISFTLKGAALIFGVFAVFYLLVKLFPMTPIAWTIAHLKSARYGLPAGGGLLYFLLLLCIVFNHANLHSMPTLGVVQAAWYLIIGVWLIFGFIYPWLFPVQLANTGSADPLSFGGRIVLMRRYFGLLTGTFVCVLCIWIVTFRVIESLYPMQLELLVKGLGPQEFAVVASVQELLQ